MARVSWGIAGLFVVVGFSMATLGGSPADAAAPKSRFEQAKIEAAIIYRKFYFNPVVGFNLGYASGSLSNTSLWASSTYWSVTLSQRIIGTPVTGFVGFHHYTNRVEGLGAVWDESLFKGGFKVNFWGGSVLPTVEESWPIPVVTGVNLTY